MPTDVVFNVRKINPESPMSIKDLAEAFTALLKNNQHEAAAAQYNSPDIVSLEAMDGPMARVQGTAALAEKGAWWYANHEIHGAEAHGPYVNGDQFAVRFWMDVTPKGADRVQMDEVGIYTVRDGKIVEERFFY
jgi:limonene-1,2-epoxide hydrolase